MNNSLITESQDLWDWRRCPETV